MSTQVMPRIVTSTIRRSPRARQRATLPGPRRYTAASVKYDEASQAAQRASRGREVGAPDGLQLTGDRVSVEHDHPTTNATSST